jgi:murein DD-endopeptidase MepM/ murein hydrolase activator NlpD
MAGAFEKDPLDREDVGEKPADRVRWAQDLMNGHPTASKLVGYRPTYKGAVDGLVGTATLKAARDMKYAVGYPADQLHATFGQALYDLLTGRRPQTAAMKARAIARKPLAAPKWSYPLAVRGQLIGFPYQGTHRLGNWQSDRGFDLGTPWGTRILAPRAGRIGDRWGDLGKGGTLYGKRIYVATTSGQEFYLAHCSTLIARPGQWVVAGQVIAYSNFPGIPHLHVTCKIGSPYTEILGPVHGYQQRFLASVSSADPESHEHFDYGEDE